jgi:hypothetical protein
MTSPSGRVGTIALEAIAHCFTGKGHASGRVRSKHFCFLSTDANIPRPCLEYALRFYATLTLLLP